MSAQVQFLQSEMGGGWWEGLRKMTRNNTEVFLASPKIIDEPVYQLKFLR